MPATFAHIVEEAHQLDIESKAELVDILKAWLIEERRSEIAQNALLAEEEYRQGKAKSGNLADLMADLNSED